MTLVKQEQDIRKKAEELKEHKVTVCHKTGSDNNPWVQIEISENALSAHLEHGDIQGNCPSGKDQEGGPTATPQTPAVGGITLATTVNVNNQTITPGLEPEVETRYVYITTRFDFKIKFQGIGEKKPDKTVRVIFRRGDEELHVYNKVVVTSDTKGIYRGTITDVKPGKFEVLIKGESYLQKKFENINIGRGLNKFDLSKDELLAGDFNQDNILEAKDVSELMSFHQEAVNPVTDETKLFDLDMNGFLGMEDINLVLLNFNVLKLEGDN